MSIEIYAEPWRPATIASFHESGDAPTVARTLVPEVFEAAHEEAEIRAAVLRKRLPRALAAIDRQIRAGKLAADEGAAFKAGLRDFVERCDEEERMTGFPCFICLLR